MKPTVFTPVFCMCAMSASEISASFCVVLNTHRFLSSIGSTTAVVPTGASIGVPLSAMNCTTPTALGEPDGPISASIFCSARSFLTFMTLCVGSLASSSTMYSTVRSPIFLGSSATEFFCGIPTTAVGPVVEAITPTFTCAIADVAANAIASARAALIRYVDFMVESPPGLALVASRARSAHMLRVSPSRPLARARRSRRR